MEMIMDVPNSEASGLRRLTLKQPQRTPSAKRIKKTSPTEHRTHLKACWQAKPPTPPSFCKTEVGQAVSPAFSMRLIASRTSRQSEAQNIGAGRDGYVLTPAGRVSHRSGL